MTLPVLRPAIIAHGVGARGDLPLPLPFFVWALGIALAVSFVALVVLWPEPKLRRLAEGRLLVRVPRALSATAGGLGLALLLLSVTAGWIGENIVVRNILPVTLYVTVWVGGALIAGLVGGSFHRFDRYAAVDALAHGFRL